MRCNAPIADAMSMYVHDNIINRDHVCTPQTACTSTPLADGWFTVYYKGIGVYQFLKYNRHADARVLHNINRMHARFTLIIAKYNSMYRVPWPY